MLMSPRTWTKLLPLLGFFGCVAQVGELGAGGASATGPGSDASTNMGADAGTEAASTSTGGASAGIGGAAPGTGGASSGTGGASSGTGGGSTSGSGGASTGTGTGGTSSSSGTGGATLAGDGVPCDLQMLFSSTCSTCHGNPPLSGLPSLMGYATLTSPSASNAGQTNAQRALARMQDNTTPMPPAPGTRASSAQITSLQTWISAGYPKTSCGSGTGGGSGAGTVGGSGAGTGGGSGAGTGGSGSDPFTAPPKCTSGKTWTSGNSGSANMNPGMACINCHSSGGEGPRFALAGTVYPSAHEPDKCNGSNGSQGIQVQITSASGQVINLTPNSVGNFSYTGSVSLPYRAKVTYMGRERIMATAQQSGDCNACHTQNGAMSAPGRILLP